MLNALISDLISREEDFCGLQIPLPFEEAQRLLLQLFSERRFGSEWVGVWLPFKISGCNPYTAEPDAEAGVFVIHYTRYYEQRADEQIQRLIGDQHGDR
jgi:hypothetical protein